MPPAFCLDIESPDGRVWVEEGMPMETIRELNARGHRVELLTGYKRSIFGRGQVIRILNDGSRNSPAAIIVPTAVLWLSKRPFITSTVSAHSAVKRLFSP